MFNRPHHQFIAKVLLCLDADLLRRHRCYFGGGTAIALLYDEYRESVYMDFLVSNGQSFSDLRLLQAGIAKAETAYGQSIQRDLQKAIARLKTNPDILDRCIDVMSVDVPKALLWQNIKRLGRGLSRENSSLL